MSLNSDFDLPSSEEAALAAQFLQQEATMENTNAAQNLQIKTLEDKLAHYERIISKCNACKAALNPSKPLKRKHGSVDLTLNKKLKPSSRSVALARKVLKENFQLEAFRLQQEAAISRLLDGQSAVVVFPTGGGKSLCYQVPAVAFAELDQLCQSQRSEGPGITIVVSPLIALMKDQVDALLKRRILATAMNSSQTREQHLQVAKDLEAGKLKLLYCAPERLNNEGFVESMRHVKGGVRLVAVDEAHCVSEWGHSFRPEYLKVARFVKEIKAERVVCLTATATTKVAQDILSNFGIPDEGLFRTAMYRPNLRLLAEATPNKQESYEKLFKFLQDHPGPAVVYVTIQKQSEELASTLTRKRFKAKAFHAGMETQKKTELQDEFMKVDDLIIVATIAFGMGIDKPNIRTIVHFNIPQSVEEYSQQIGRAGRDGKPSTCLFFLCPEDFYLRNVFTYGDLPARASVREFLKSIFDPFKLTVDQSGSGKSFRTSHYTQTKEFDIKMSPLAILYAELELQFGLIRATTPIYSTYQYEVSDHRRWHGDNSAAANIINKSAKPGKKWYTLDLDVASLQGGIVRADLIRKLNQWNDSGIVVMKASGVQNVYKVLKELPTTDAQIDDITRKLYTQMLDREKQALERTKQVVGLVTEKQCFSRALAAYFGDGSDGLSEECGHCTWCETHVQVQLPNVKPAPPNPGSVDAIMKACPIRDDPRLLARIGFGITSPRIMALGLKKSGVWESMNVCDFPTLVGAFATRCKVDPY
ncbi:P-loop containing nucleoside triphosphate hydrolase protein [Clohesyomyces aquaticus]|uniref:ATP-dependent DNA helicase n=1 Tax=Clohesyomyces aquaticus TaxID=1231657 RepID=A0A1Y1YTG7_9PLEO|nr:P-loop containing nucleoside triphosphate hydrolase protein [Clohesyomyces aquaticus]